MPAATTRTTTRTTMTGEAGNNNNIFSDGQWPSPLELLKGILLLILGVFHVFFVVLILIFFFTPYSAFMGLRYCYRRRRHPEIFEQQELAFREAQNYRVNGRVLRRKKPKLMSQALVDEMFPVMTYKEAKLAAPSLAEQHDHDNENDGQTQQAYPTITGNTSDKMTTCSTLNNDPSAVHSHLATHMPSPPPDAHLATRGREREADITTHEQPEDAFEKGPSVESQAVPMSPAPSLHSEDAGHEDSEDDPEPTVDLAAMNGASDSTCAICIEEMEDQEEVRLLTCGHIYHLGCIDPWLTTRRAYCPLCKHDYYVAPPPEQVSADAPADGSNSPNSTNNGTASESRNTVPVSRRRVLANLFTSS